MLIEDHHQLDKHVIGQIIKPIVKTNPTVSIKTLTFMNYAPSYKKSCLYGRHMIDSYSTMLKSPNYAHKWVIRPRAYKI